MQNYVFLQPLQKNKIIWDISLDNLIFAAERVQDSNRNASDVNRYDMQTMNKNKL